MGKLERFNGRANQALIVVKKKRPMKGKRLVASTALKKVIRKEIAEKAEVKQVDATFSGTFTTTLALATGGTTTASDIVEGVSEVQRVGDQILVKSLNLRANIATGNTFDAEEYAYIALVLYKNCDGRNPDPAEVWTTTSNIGISLRHPDFLTEYSVLKIVKVKLIPRYGVAAASAPQQNVIWNHRFKGQGMKVQYDGNSGAATDVITNNIFIYLQCVGISATHPLIVGGVLRINYTD